MNVALSRAPATTPARRRAVVPVFHDDRSLEGDAVFLAPTGRYSASARDHDSTFGDLERRNDATANHPLLHEVVHGRSTRQDDAGGENRSASHDRAFVNAAV